MKHITWYLAKDKYSDFQKEISSERQKTKRGLKINGSVSCYMYMSNFLLDIDKDGRSQQRLIRLGKEILSYGYQVRMFYRIIWTQQTPGSNFCSPPGSIW